MKALLSVLALLLAASPVILFMCLFTWLRRSAGKHQPRQEGSSLVFSVAPGMQFLLRSVLVALTLFTILVLVASRSNGGSFVAAVIPVSIFAALVLAMPRPVTLDHNGVRQPQWIRRDREIAWNEIVSVRRGQNTGATYVRGRSGGRPISFSPLLVAQSRFEREVRSHARHCNDFDVD